MSKWPLRFVAILILCLTSAYAQNVGGVIIPFDPLKLLPKTGNAPQDSLNKRTIEIIHSDFLEQETDTTSNLIRRILKGHVRLLHDGALMTCDSAILFPQSNYLEAKGKVVIRKGDSIEVRSDLLKYNGDTKIAILENNVTLKDRNSILTAPIMTYEVDKDIGHFWDHGKLVSDSTNLTSKTGTHYQKDGYAVFKGNVVLVSPDYTMLADSMKYFTETKIAYFITETTIISGEDTIITSDGYFDTQKNKAVLKGRPLIKNGNENILQSDHLDYDKEIGIGIATGNVVSRNLKENATLLSNHVYYIDSIKYTRATQNPLLIKEDKKDTLYLSADTLINFSVPLSQWNQVDNTLTDSLFSQITETDSLIKDSLVRDLTTSLDSLDITPDESLAKEKLDTTAQNLYSDSLIDIIPDSLHIDQKEDSVKVFYGYKDVKLIRTKLSGICDSIYFNSQDSIFRLFYNPVLWMDSTQLKADSIYIFMKDEEAERIELYNNAIIINESAPGVYNQIAGKKITGWLIDNELRHVLVDGNAECIYYLKNDSNEYSGGNQAKSALINISFNEESEIERIKLEISPEAIFTPIQLVDYPSYRLPNFDWYWSYKPKDKWDVIRDTVQYMQYIQEHPPVLSDTIVPMDSIVIDSTMVPQNLLLEDSEETIMELPTFPEDEKQEKPISTTPIHPESPPAPKRKNNKHPQ